MVVSLYHTKDADSRFLCWRDILEDFPLAYFLNAFSATEREGCAPFPLT